MRLWACAGAYGARGPGPKYPSQIIDSVERGKPVPRSALGVALGGLDREIRYVPISGVVGQSCSHGTPYCLCECRGDPFKKSHLSELEPTRLPRLVSRRSAGISLDSKCAFAVKPVSTNKNVSAYPDPLRPGCRRGRVWGLNRWDFAAFAQGPRGFGTRARPGAWSQLWRSRPGLVPSSYTGARDPLPRSGDHFEPLFSNPTFRLVSEYFCFRDLNGS